MCIRVFESAAYSRVSELVCGIFFCLNLQKKIFHIEYYAEKLLPQYIRFFYNK